MATLETAVNTIYTKYKLTINLDKLLAGIKIKDAPCLYEHLQKNESSNLTPASINKLKMSPATCNYTKYTPDGFFTGGPKITFVIICNWGFIYLGDKDEAKLQLFENIIESNITTNCVTIRLDKKFKFEEITLDLTELKGKFSWIKLEHTLQSYRESWALVEWMTFIDNLKSSIYDFSNHYECTNYKIIESMKKQLDTVHAHTIERLKDKKKTNGNTSNEYTVAINKAITDMQSRAGRSGSVPKISVINPLAALGGRRKTKRSKRTKRTRRNKKCKRRTRRS